MTIRRRHPFALSVALLAVILVAASCATIGLVETIEALLKQIQELLAAKKWDEALTKVTEVVRREPTQWRAYLYGAQAYIGKSDWTQALAQARKAFELAPREGEALTTLTQSLLGAGRQALSRGDYQGASGLLAEYVRHEPTDVSAYLDLGKAYWNAGNRGDAFTAFRRVLELAPQNEEARRFLFGR